MLNKEASDERQDVSEWKKAKGSIDWKSPSA